MTELNLESPAAQMSRRTQDLVNSSIDRVWWAEWLLIRTAPLVRQTVATPVAAWFGHHPPANTP